MNHDTLRANDAPSPQKTEELKTLLRIENIAPQDLPLLDLEAVKELQRGLEVHPEQTLKDMRSRLDGSLTLKQAQTILTTVEEMLQHPADFQEALAPFASPLTEGEIRPWFPDYDPRIPIDATDTQFETWGDWPRWAFLAGPPRISMPLRDKAPFRRHETAPSGTDYIYPIHQSHDRPTEIALFSDFGTGKYHSRYIASQMEKKKYPYAIHLGDVYYAGRQKEFETNFIEPLQGVLPVSRFFAMNGNHEMMSMGTWYFQFIDRLRNYAHQEQEGSYFCLRGSAYQIIGVDTDYFSFSRFPDLETQRWLTARLLEGRQLGLINILLTGDEPYEFDSTKITDLYTQDLYTDVHDRKLVDLWLWGNTHYCALFDRSNDFPFIGSCIGHGGYPYDRVSREEVRCAAPVKFLETSARFPAHTNLRQDRGNNGYCVLRFPRMTSGELTAPEIELEYIDWLGHQRCVTVMSREAGVLKITSCRELPTD